MTHAKGNTLAPADAGGFEWRKIHARLTGGVAPLDAADIRHEYEDEARNAMEVFRSIDHGNE